MSNKDKVEASSPAEALAKAFAMVHKPKAKPEST